MSIAFITMVVDSLLFFLFTLETLQLNNTIVKHNTFVQMRNEEQKQTNNLLELQNRHLLLQLNFGTGQSCHVAIYLHSR